MNPKSTEPDIIVVLAPWSSGSTALTGYLSRLGAWSCPPHQLTNDPRTPDSHESKDFRNALCECFDEFTLEPKIPARDLSTFLIDWLKVQRIRARDNGQRSIVLKHPLAALALDTIITVADPKFVVGLRPLDQIEATRTRRGWHPIYGRSGAKQIYEAVFSGLLANGRSFVGVSYPDFMEHRSSRERLATALDLTPNANQVASAEAWISCGATRSL